MSNLHSVTIDITETMNDVIIGMPEQVAITFLVSILEMACIMTKTGDIDFDFVDQENPQFKVTALTRSGELNLHVDLLSV